MFSITPVLFVPTNGNAVEALKQLFKLSLLHLWD